MCTASISLLAFSMIGGAGFSISIYEDEVGIRENLPIALDWIAKNAGSAGGPDQIVSEGTVIMQMH